MLTCVMTMILACGGSRLAPALNVAHTAVAFSDTYATQRTMDLCNVFAGCNPSRVEGNPLMRPFQSVGKPAAYVFTFWGTKAASGLAQKMRTTSSPKWRWTHKVWWLPQVALIGASIYGTQSNVSLYNSRLAQCGMGCALALR